MQRSFVIFSPGHTGENLIQYNLDQYLKFFTSNQYLHTVTQRYTANYQPTHKDFTCIISRRDLVEQVCDYIITEENITTPTAISVDQFRAVYKRFNDFYTQIDLSPYKKVVEIYYEDLITDPYYFFGQFNLVDATDYSKFTIPTHDYSTLITNFDVLKQIANNRELGNFIKDQRSVVIYSPMRTGSTIIYNNLLDHMGFTESSKFPYTVMHTHNPKDTPAETGFTCILSKRKNILDMACSAVIAEKTNEYAEYTGQTVEPFSVSVEQVRQRATDIIDFYNQIDLSIYANVLDIWFDDLLADPYYLYKQFGIDEQIQYDKKLKSPYNYYNIITNIEELKSIAINEGWYELY